MKNNKLLIIACVTLVASIIFAYCIITISIHSAAAEEEQAVQEEVVEQIPIEPEPTPVPVVQVVPDPMEVQWQEALQQVPPLTKSGGVGNAGGYKFTYYSSRVLYHYRTPEWRLDNNGCYRAWNGSQWCFVISMNSSYGYMGQTIQFDFGPCIVLDSGCAQGVVDLYVKW